MRLISYHRKLSKHKRLLKTIHERYIRPDIPCSFSCCQSPHKYRDISSHLLNDISFIVIPTKEVLVSFLPLFQSKLVNSIILQSVLNDIRFESSSLCKRVMDAIKEQFVFYNDIFNETFVEDENYDFFNQRHNENIDLTANNENANTIQDKDSDDNNIINKDIDINLYRNNLDLSQNVSLGLNKNNRKIIDLPKTEIEDTPLLLNSFIHLSPKHFSFENEFKKFQRVFTFYQSHCSTQNILVLTKDNIKNLPYFYKNPQSIQDLLSHSQKECTDYSEYYNEDKIGVFLHEGIVVKGILYVNNFNCFSGIVHAEFKGRSVKVKILGRKDMNRAMNLDGVYVEILNVTEISDNKDEEFNKGKESDVIDNNGNNVCNAKIFHSKQSNNKLDKNSKGVLEGGKTEDYVFGKVVGLYKRDYKPLIATIDKNTINGTGAQYVLTIPLDRRIPKIRIRTSQADELEGKRILIRINEWKKDSYYPFGSYLRVIGEVGDKKSEIESILLANGIDYTNYTRTFGLENVINNLKSKLTEDKIETNENSELESIVCNVIENKRRSGHCEIDKRNFGKENQEEYSEKAKNLEKELEIIYKKIVEQELKSRIDLREENVCSIDPPGCTDIDDALHCKIKGNEIEIGVHIADVTYFVSPESDLDLESRKRGTSVYLTDRRIDMLPEYLSSNLCSLVENEERLAFSVFWIFDKNFEIKKNWFARTVIKSKKSFTYEEAQNLINQYEKDKKNSSITKKSDYLKNKNKYDFLTKTKEEIDNSKNLAGGVWWINKIAKKLKKDRYESGALELSSNEVKIHFDSDKNDSFFPKVHQIENKILFETNSLVEEFMLLANISVANEIYNKFNDRAMLRKHPKFADDSFDELKEYLEKKDIKLEYLTSKQLNDSIKSMKNGKFKEMIKKIITRSMNQAIYFSSGSCPYEEYLHYGLATPIYTHFTSPIRRYADIIVHRQLEKCLKNDQNKYLTSNEIEEICKNINYRNRSAMYASMDCNKLFIYLYIKNKKISKYEAFIIRINKNGIVVYVSEIGIEETINIENLDYNEVNNCFEKEDNVVYKVYDVVEVLIKENDEMFFIKRRFDIEIVGSTH